MGVALCKQDAKTEAETFAKCLQKWREVGRNQFPAKLQGLAGTHEKSGDEAGHCAAIFPLFALLYSASLLPANNSNNNNNISNQNNNTSLRQKRSVNTTETIPTTPADTYFQFSNLAGTDILIQIITIEEHYICHDLWQHQCHV